MKPSHRSPLARMAGIFVAGALAILPMAVTIVVLSVGVSLAYEWLGPSSLFGTALVKLGFGLGGSEFVSYLVGVGVVLILVFATGLLVEFGMRRWLRRTTDTLLGKIPVVKTVYETAGNFVSMLSRDSASPNGMTPVWCQFGEESSVLVLGLLSSPEAVLIAGKRFRPVIVPTAPVPVGGGLLFLAEERVIPAEGVGIESLTSIYVSMGVTAPRLLASNGTPPSRGNND